MEMKALLKQLIVKTDNIKKNKLNDVYISNK